MRSGAIYTVDRFIHYRLYPEYAQALNNLGNILKVRTCYRPSQQLLAIGTSVSHVNSSRNPADHMRLKITSIEL